MRAASLRRSDSKASSRACAVAAVQLDGEPLFAPEAIDDVGRALHGHRHVGLRLAQACATPELGEAVLELAADYLARAVLRDRLLQGLQVAAAVSAFNGSIEGVKVEEALVLRLSQCS